MQLFFEHQIHKQLNLQYMTGTKQGQVVISKKFLPFF